MKRDRPNAPMTIRSAPLSAAAFKMAAPASASESAKIPGVRGNALMVEIVDDVELGRSHGGGERRPRMSDQHAHLFGPAQQGQRLAYRRRRLSAAVPGDKRAAPKLRRGPRARHDQRRMAGERELHRRAPQQIARVAGLLDHRQILQAAGMDDEIGGVALPGQPAMRDTGTVGDGVEPLLGQQSPVIFALDAAPRPAQAQAAGMDSAWHS